MEVGRDHLSWVLLSSGGETLSLALYQMSLKTGPGFKSTGEPIFSVMR